MESTSTSHGDADWHWRIVGFLTAHPDSTLLAVVQNLCPDYLDLPPDQRARLWFWVKDQLHLLRAAGVLTCREDEAGVALWSVLNAPVVLE